MIIGAGTEVIVDFIEGVISFWMTRDKAHLAGFLPEDVYEKVRTSGPYIDDLHAIFTDLFRRKGFSRVADLLHLTEGDLQALTETVEAVSPREKRRAFLAVRFYQLLHRKYRLDPLDIGDHLSYAATLGLPNPASLIERLSSENVSDRLEGILQYLGRLKEVILSPEKNEPVENIFRKRHIAAGIPSLYGKYHERKFDALALSFRLENLTNVLFEELIQKINLNFITRAALFQIDKYLNLFYAALQLDGISSALTRANERWTALADSLAITAPAE